MIVLWIRDERLAGFVEARRRKMALRHFTLEYWTDEGWYVGRLKEVPGIFSQEDLVW